ncbi:MULTISPECIES: glycoside hydrolase family 18 protein [Metallibacterium]|jgi:chitinase|uniref:glycoside hydrolase family 18 protein n=1 Tax=Metallibacterium TaxID=1218803 RepID=UPI0026260D53|nr:MULTISPECIES: glycoside hydrolase family 18 protein [Metallibacterium]
MPAIHRFPSSTARAHALGLLAGLVMAAMAVPAWAAATVAAPGPKVIGYVTQWSPTQDAQLRMIDTLIFAFAEVHDARVVLTAEAAARLRTIVALKALDPRLRVEISIGGWGAGGFSEAARTAAGRHTFARTAAALVASTGTDGIDVDWEYPTISQSGIKSSPHDRADFTLLLKDIRAALDQVGAARGQHYTLSIAIADGPFVKGIDIPMANRYVDWFNLMTYDFVNALTPTTGNHTGLYASKWAPATARTVNRAVRQFLAAGVPPRKLVIGVAFYGRAFADVRPLHHGMYQPYGHFIAMIPWPKLVSNYIDKNGYKRYWDARAHAPYLWNARSRSFITYDDPRSIAAKDAYVKAHHLGGVMYWEQSLDPGGTLLKAIYDGLH